MAMENISIFGSGFVGGAVYHGLSPFYNVKIYDKYKPGYNGLEETIDFSRYIFAPSWNISLHLPVFFTCTLSFLPFILTSAINLLILFTKIPSTIFL